jgi:hypothetical protein
VTYRKKKLLLIQISIFIFACSLIFFSYYNQNSQILLEVNKSNSSIEKKKLLTEKESNTFENIEYNGIDLNGNRYLIKSENADFLSGSIELYFTLILFISNEIHIKYGK